MALLLYGPEGTGKTFLAGAFLGSVEEVKRKGYATLNANVLLAEPTRMENIPKALLQFETPYLLIEDVDLLFQDLGQFPASRRALLAALGADSPITVIATARYPEKLKAEEVAAFMHIIPLMFPSAEDREALLRHAARANEATISTLVEQTEWWTPKEVLDFGREVSNDFSPAAIEAALARHRRSVTRAKANGSAAIGVHHVALYGTRAERRASAAVWQKDLRGIGA
jgi:SpoVK/Ycf46/Vps4 family AAA+-type ATPase